MDSRLRGMMLRMMLSAYKDWKHPSRYDNNNKQIQEAKDRFFRYKKLYNERMQIDFHTR